MSIELRATKNVLGSEIDVVSWEQAIERLKFWGTGRESRYVTICNVHVVMTAHDDAEYRAIINGADMATPDGAPIAWFLRRLGVKAQRRINGPDLMWKFCSEMDSNPSRDAPSIFLYGGSESSLKILVERLKEEMPKLNIAGYYSPPFRALTEHEDAEIVEMINASGAGVVWVGLGCPKQERWMASHKGKVKAVMVGVGAAFDYHANVIKRAPIWMQNWGLEWLYRLGAEPKRLWRRYYDTNSAFILEAINFFLFSRKEIK